jgi:hypothetical protein
MYQRIVSLLWTFLYGIMASLMYYDKPQFQAFDLLYEKLKHCKRLAMQPTVWRKSRVNLEQK